MTTNSMAGIMFQDSLRARHPGYGWAKGGGVGSIGVNDTRMTKDFSNGNRDIIGIATTDDVDESMEVVLPGGADLSYINATKMLYADHSYGISQVVGSIRYLRPSKSGKGWDFRASLFTGMKSPLADDCFTIIEQGGQLGVSIGFEATEWGDPVPAEVKAYPKAQCVIRKWRWVELSLTAMPCNVSCRAVLAPSEGEQKQVSFIEGLVTKGKIRRESAVALGLTHLNRGILTPDGAKSPRQIVLPRAFVV